ncbi:hypothetical protein BT96DRAFT_953057 [Gymnopus androsaceus JB14]|uniref:DUF7962 domain-containing protein n=1 Tax=Gymnopus androsaceus JB14 TaxID=1447944 RepID=A0A6A4IN85_9AGAR|nr:hypothetical protein BT96DRAFT_953057 [Gymnopus androsaceus JB14]
MSPCLLCVRAKRSPHSYDSSPFSIKIDNILLLKNIPHSTVQVSPVLPRPEITVLLIASALERRFPAAQGFGTIFPAKNHGGSPDTGLLKAFTKYYADTVLFAPGVGLLPWDRIPESFLNDRRIAMALIDEQLQDGREWLFDTKLPSLVDIGVEFIYSWVRGFQNTASLFDSSKSPYALKWLERMDKFLKAAQKNFSSPKALSGADAARLIANSPHEPYDVVGFNADEAKRLKVVQGQMVTIIPDDTGPNFATTGKLVALNHEEFVIETKATELNAIFRIHFPRLGFTPKAAAEHKL